MENRDIVDELMDYRLSFLPNVNIIYSYNPDFNKDNKYITIQHSRRILKTEIKQFIVMLEGLVVVPRYIDSYGGYSSNDFYELPTKTTHLLHALCDVVYGYYRFPSSLMIDNLHRQSGEIHELKERIRNSTYLYINGIDNVVNADIWNDSFYTKKNILKLYADVMHNEKRKILRLVGVLSYGRRREALLMWWYSWLI